MSYSHRRYYDYPDDPFWCLCCKNFYPLKNKRGYGLCLAYEYPNLDAYYDSKQYDEFRGADLDEETGCPIIQEDETYTKYCPYFILDESSRYQTDEEMYGSMWD